jgi:hypothetical protein
MYKRFLFVLLAGLLCTMATAQNQASARFHFLKNYRGDGMLAYNFFTGPDAADFQTSIKGFGSGLVDYFGTRYSIDVVTYGNEKIYLSMGAGLSVMKYRLSDHLVFVNPGNGAPIQYFTDPDPTHNYQDTFFGWGKSKIITVGAYFPLDVNIAIGKSMIFSAGAYADLNLSARYKMKYKVGEDQIKELIRSEEFRDFNINPFKYGVTAGLFFKKLKRGISCTYSLAPFFTPGGGPELHETRVTASFAIVDLKEAASRARKQNEE